MKTISMNKRVKTVSPRYLITCLLTSPLGLAVFAQGSVILVSPHINNGSFESGGLAPWVADNLMVHVEHDPHFATEGDYYARFASATFGPSASLNVRPNPAAGLEFRLSFDARMGDPGLRSVAVKISGRSPDGPMSASVAAIAEPPLNPQMWQRYEYSLLMPGAWDEYGIYLGIRFTHPNPLGGVTYVAFLDNVVLTQIPEPSAGALLALGVAGLLLGRAGRRPGWPGTPPPAPPGQPGTKERSPPAACGRAISRIHHRPRPRRPSGQSGGSKLRGGLAQPLCGMETVSRVRMP